MRNWNGASRPGVMKTLLPLAFSALLIAGCAAPETSLRVKRSTSRSRHVESVLRMLSSLLSVLSATLGHIQSARFEVLLRHQILDTRINSCRKAQALRKIGLSAESGRSVHQKHLFRLAMEGAQISNNLLPSTGLRSRTSSCDLICNLDRHGDTEARLTG